jgi:hypothetical protein
MTFSPATVRAILAIIIVTGCFVVCAALVVLPMLSGLQNAKEFVGVAKDFGAIFTGLIGTIIGYYFGQSTSTDA